MMKNYDIKIYRDIILLYISWEYKSEENEKLYVHVISIKKMKNKMMMKSEIKKS